MNFKNFTHSFCALYITFGVIYSIAPAYAEETKAERAQEKNIEKNAMADPTEVYDPFEGLNRSIFAFNHVVDKYAIRPVAVGYRWVVPEWGRDRINNFLTNLTTPVTLLNSILQGDVNNSFTCFWRFFINTTIGLGGLFDEASELGLKYQPEDFGQTLGVYSVPAGPYLVIPLLGPSNARDITGRVVDVFTDPLSYVDSNTFVYSYYGARLLNARSEIMPVTDDIDNNSFDPYVTYRSYYDQNRKNLIRNGQ